MKEVLCYKLDDGSLFENKEQALIAEQKLNNKQVLDYRQIEQLKFKKGDTVYIACRDRIRQCTVKAIYEHSYYDEDIDEIYTAVDLDDLNDITNTFTFSTSEHNRDLNTVITTKFVDLCNFDYEANL